MSQEPVKDQFFSLEYEGCEQPRLGGLPFTTKSDYMKFVTFLGSISYTCLAAITEFSLLYPHPHSWKAPFSNSGLERIHLV